MGHGIHFLCHQPCVAAIPRGPISQSTVVMVPWGHITTSWDWLERVWHWAICGSRGTTDGHQPQWAKPLMVAELVLIPLQVTLDLPVANCGLILSDLFQGWLNLTQEQSLPTRPSVLLQNPKDTKITLPLTWVFHPRWDHLFLKADIFRSLTISWTSLHVCTYTVCQALARPGDTAAWSLQVITAAQPLILYLLSYWWIFWPFSVFSWLHTVLQLTALYLHLCTVVCFCTVNSWSRIAGSNGMYS